MCSDAGFREAFAAAKRANKVDLAAWIADETGIAVDPDAMFDVQVKRIHEYKRQLMNLLQTVADWHALRENPNANAVPRVQDLWRQGGARLCNGQG